MGADEDGDQVVPAGRVLDHRHRYPPDGRAACLGELHAVPAQGGQALAPGEERDVVPGLMQAGGEQAAGNPGAVHEQFHDHLLPRVRFSHTFVLVKRMYTTFMTPPDTRTQLLDAAERLFAEHGYRGTSVRTITDLAGANLAAVGYHFGSKAELLAAVARRVIGPVNAAQCAGLDRLLARTPDPSAAELVAAFAGPLFDEMPAGDEGGARTSRLIVTIIADPAEEARSWTGPAEATVRDRYLAAFGRALPGLSPQELWFRMRGFLAVVAVDRVEAYNQPAPGCVTPVAGEAARRWAITFLAAAMSAPPTGT